MGLGYFVIIGVFMLLGSLVSGQLKSKMRKYGKMPTSSGLSGAEVAATMLRDSGIQDVKIVQGKGMLTDHYNPKTKTISLSPAIFQGRNVAAAAVAAHECGHAVQHATEYPFLQMRSQLVPIVKLSSGLYFWLILAGLGMGFMQLAWVGVALFGAATLFSLVTLPVEFDASNRALAWLDKTGITRGQEYSGAKDALKWAARTYVVAAFASIAQLLYWFMVVQGRN
ncbi:MAG: zinc metallopeptidase [Saprospiraceae bacterium]|nr:zinc metallopeptidase [Saprospiraceae bacterium]